MEIDPTRMCELLVGLPDVNVLGVADGPGWPLRILIASDSAPPECSWGRWLDVKDARR